MNGRARLDLIVAVAILLALIVANAAIYAPRRRQLNDVTEHLEQAEQELLYVAGHSDALVQVEDYLPASHGDAGDQRFLSEASSELDRLDVALSRIEPQGETPYGTYMRRTYKMQLEGKYKGLTSFFEYLERMSDVVLVEAFDVRSSALTSSGSKHKGSLTVAVIGY